MEKLREDFKKIILAVIGAIATTAEKSSEMLDEMVKKGELTVEQGKILNQELKHNIQAAMASKKTNDTDDVYAWVKSLTPEQLAAMKDMMNKKDETKPAEEPAKEEKPEDTAAPAEE